MAALFYSYSNGDMLVSSLASGGTPVTTDIFDGLVSADNLAIITSISINNTETYQLFMTFDDFIHYYYFGKGIGQIQIQGMLFGDCSGSFPGLNTLYTAVGDKRGQTVTVSTGGFSFTGVLQDCNISFVSEPETIVNFSVGIAMIDHTLSTPSFTPPC